MYSLTDKDRKIIQGTINKVNNLTGNMSPNPKRRSKPAFRYAEITGDLENGFYSAKEIRFLADGTHEDAPNGIVWDGEKVKLLITGGVSTGVVTRVEPFYMVDETKVVNIWAGSAVGGGGDTVFRIRINNQVELTGGVTLSSLGDADVSINDEWTPCLVSQDKFLECTLYENETLYGGLLVIDDTTNLPVYDLSPYLAGIGGGVSGDINE